MGVKVDKGKKVKLKGIIKLIVFIAVANLPFLTITSLVGIDTFIDSFENPENYYFIQENGNSMNYNIKDGNYVVIQKTLDPDEEIHEGDIVIYSSYKGGLDCKKVYQIYSIGPIKKYHAVDNNNKLTDEPIYENQIIGKVVNVIDGNIWNMIAMKIWDISINEYNINTFLNL